MKTEQQIRDRRQELVNYLEQQKVNLLKDKVVDSKYLYNQSKHEIVVLNWILDDNSIDINKF